MTAPAFASPAAARVAGATVAVLTGGTSNEREIALQSGRSVLTALADRDERGPERVLVVEIEADGRWRLDGTSHDACAALDALPKDTLFFLALHGGDGENGVVQGFLELAGHTYTGSGVGASALCMDKDATRHVLAASGVPVAPGLCIHPRSWADAREVLLARAAALLAPRADALVAGDAYVKPNAGGSSVHTYRVTSPAELETAIDKVLDTGDRALVESAVHGVEATCGVLGNGAGRLVALPPVEIVPHAGHFFDYAEKYRADGATEHCPPRTLSAATVARLGELALAAHRVTGCDGYSRTDFIVPRAGAEDAGEPVALEINTLPGLTERSLFPQSMHAAGRSYRDMCLALLGLAVERRLTDARLVADAHMEEHG